MILSLVKKRLIYSVFKGMNKQILVTFLRERIDYKYWTILKKIELLVSVTFFFIKKVKPIFKMVTKYYNFENPSHEFDKKFSKHWEVCLFF